MRGKKLLSRLRFGQVAVAAVALIAPFVLLTGTASASLQPFSYAQGGWVAHTAGTRYFQTITGDFPLPYVNCTGQGQTVALGPGFEEGWGIHAGVYASCDREGDPVHYGSIACLCADVNGPPSIFPGLDKVLQAGDWIKVTITQNTRDRSLWKLQINDTNPNHNRTGETTLTCPAGATDCLQPVVGEEVIQSQNQGGPLNVGVVNWKNMYLTDRNGVKATFNPKAATWTYSPNNMTGPGGTPTCVTMSSLGAGQGTGTMTYVQGGCST